MFAQIFHHSNNYIVLALAISCFATSALLAKPCPPQSQQELAAAKTNWEDSMLPIIEDACIACHSGDDADGSLDLDVFESVENVVDQRRLWAKIATRVRDEQMPPKGGPKLKDKDRVRFLEFIDETLPTLPCSHDHHAGAVTIRRLTRYEYANTVRDLLQVNYKLTDGFPADEVGYGFDNIGDVLSVSPLLFEKYLMAAEAISHQVIQDPAKMKFEKTVSSDEFDKGEGKKLAGGYCVMFTNASISPTFSPAVAGRYKITVTAYAQQAGDDLARISVSANGVEIDQSNVRSDDSETPNELEFNCKLKAGRNVISVAFINDYYNPKAPRNDRDRNLAIGNVKVQGPMTTPEPSDAQKRFLFVTPSNKKSARECAIEVINLQGARTFRRRVYEGERERLIQLFDLGVEQGESYEGAMQLVLQAMLVSPHFLYKVEAPASGDGSMRHLSDYEIATSLSYFLWSSMPDDRLFRLATSGTLNDTGVLESEVKRMLQDPRSIALIDNFAAQWLQLRILDQVDPDPDLYPGFTDHLRDSMSQETRLLLQDVIQKNETLTTLLTADYTYLNKALAKHYGWSTKGLRSKEFSRVSLVGKERRGILSHASFLTLTSNPTRTSPVKRGKWVLENLLADPPPPALADVPQLDSQLELKGTLRERMEQHRADPNCATCHYKMDSLGFALENFDGFGRFRDEEDGVPIDSSGELPGGYKFTSVAELQNQIVQHQRKQFTRCVVEKLYVYGLGRGPQSIDDCLIDQITERAMTNNHGFHEIVLGIVTSEAFLNRVRVVDATEDKKAGQ